MRQVPALLAGWLSSFQAEIEKTESELNSAAAALAEAEVPPAQAMANADSMAGAQISPAQEAAPAIGEKRAPAAAVEKPG